MSDFDDKATVTGAIASFNNGADEVPVDSGTFYIAPSQSGTGTPSPSNPRPIVGYTGMTIQHTGKNLLNYADITDSYKITSITDNGNGSFTVVGSNNGAWIQHIVPVKAGQAYSIKCASATNDEGNASQIGVVDVWDGTDTTATKLLDGASITNRKGFTPTGNYVLVRNRVTGGSGAGTGTINQPQLEIGTTATSFEAYKAKTPIVDDFGRTIYGGERKTDGTLTESYAKVLVSGLSWTYYEPVSGLAYCWATVSDKVQTAVGDTEHPLLCSMLEYGGCNYASQFTDVKIWQASNKNIYLVDSSCADKNAYMTKYGNAEIAYPLATPNEYTLSPISLSTYYGDNNVWCDTGDTELTYYKFGYGYTSVTVNRTGKNLMIPPTYLENSDSLVLDLGKNKTFSAITLSFLATNSEVANTSSALVDYREENGTHHYKTLNDFRDENNVPFSASDANSGKYKNTYSNVTFRYVYISYQSSGRSRFTSDSLSNFQLELGSSASEYEAFSGVSKTAKLHKVIYAGEVDVIKGTAKPKNLLKVTDGTYTIGNTGASATISNGSVVVTGTTTNSGGRTTRLSDYFILKAGTYMLSPVLSTSPYVRSYLNKKSDNTVVGYSSGNSFTVEEDVEVYFGINVESGYTYDATITPQLEIGTSITDYAPYFEPFTFTPISMETVEGLNVLYANEGDSTITYRKSAD